MRNSILLGTIAVLGLALTACDQNTASNPSPPNQTASQEPAPGSKNDTISAAKDAVSGAVGKLSAELTSSTKGFVESAAMGDMYEIAAAKIATQRARSADVKKFAQDMIDAHTGTTGELKDVLMRANVAVTLPVELDSRHQSLIDDLMGAKAEDFDGRFLSQQTAAHEEALILMRGYAKDGDNPDLKAFAAMTQPKVQMHLDRLASIEDAQKARQRRADNG